MAGRGDTWDVTSEDAGGAGAGGRHGVKQGERERVDGCWENPAGKSSGVGSREGRPKASGVPENSGGDCQGVGGGVELPRVTDTPGVEEFPRWDETSVVTLKGNGLLGTDRRGQGGDGN